MDLKDTHDYSAPMERVMAMFADRDAITARYEGMGHRDVTITECTSTDSSLHIKTSRVVEVELPSFAKKVLQPTNTMVQTDEWTRDGDGWKGSFDVEVHGAPAKISGTMRLDPNGDGCTHAVSIKVEVKVPLVGGKIADWIGKNDAKQTLAAEFEAGERWLAAHPD